MKNHFASSFLPPNAFIAVVIPSPHAARTTNTICEHREKLRIMSFFRLEQLERCASTAMSVKTANLLLFPGRNVGWGFPKVDLLLPMLFCGHKEEVLGSD